MGYYQKNTGVKLKAFSLWKEEGNIKIKKNSSCNRWKTI